MIAAFSISPLGGAEEADGGVSAAVAEAVSAKN